MDVVERISQVPAGENGFANTPVRILKIAIENKKVQPFLTATPAEMRRTVTLKTTLGDLKIKMEPDWAPETVRNFLMLVETGWYNGTVFHRIVKDFVVQGGMADKRSTGPVHPADRWVHPIKGEFRADVKHERGIVSMARADDPNSATTSFFLMLGPAPHLDGQYAAFGRIVEGIEVLDAFEKEELDGETPKRRLEIVTAILDERMTRLSLLAVAALAGVSAFAQSPPHHRPVFKFAVSGDSRNCGDVVMPAIAASVLKSGASFYWHLGDFRAIYDFDEDMAPPARLGLNAPHLTIVELPAASLARFHLPPARAVRESRSFPRHREP